MAVLEVGSKVQVIQVGAHSNAAPQEDKIDRDTATMWVTENNGSFMKSTRKKRGDGKKAVFEKIEAVEEPKTEETEPQQQLPATLPATGKLTQEQVQQFVQYYEDSLEFQSETEKEELPYFAVFTRTDSSELMTHFITEEQYNRHKKDVKINTLYLIIHSKYDVMQVLELEYSEEIQVYKTCHLSIEAPAILGEEYNPLKPSFTKEELQEKIDEAAALFATGKYQNYLEKENQILILSVDSDGVLSLIEKERYDDVEDSEIGCFVDGGFICFKADREPVFEIKQHKEAMQHYKRGL